MVPAADHYGVGVLPYFPLANGLLTGKVDRAAGPAAGTRLAEPRKARSVTEARLDAVDRLSAWAQEHGHTVLEVAVAGLLAHPVTGSVIAGAMTAEQVTANAAAGEWELTDDEADDLADHLEADRPSLRSPGRVGRHTGSVDLGRPWREYPSAAAMAAQTPPGRDRVVDLVRAGSLVVVVFGHSFMALVVFTDHGTELGNTLAETPALQPATWLLQVMPLFFAAGAWANALSYRSATAIRCG